MRDKIEKSLGSDLCECIEDKCKSLGISDIWERAWIKAKSEIPDADEHEIVARAAIRSFQISGMIPKTQKRDDTKKEDDKMDESKSLSIIDSKSKPKEE